MEIPRDSESFSFEKTAQALKYLASAGEVPELSGKGTRALEAWFLGTKAENADVLERLVVEAIRDQAFWRRNYHPGDPTHITEEMRRTQNIWKRWIRFRKVFGLRPHTFLFALLLSCPAKRTRDFEDRLHENKLLLSAVVVLHHLLLRANAGAATVHSH